MPRPNKRKRDETRFGRPTRLADQIFELRWFLPAWCEARARDDDWMRRWHEERRQLQEDVARATVVVADNVSEYFYAEDSKEYWEFANDFPACMPPFPDLFIEMDRPSRIIANGVPESAQTLPDRWGWLFGTESRAELLQELGSPEGRAALLRNVQAQMSELAPQIDARAIQQVAQAEDQEAAFMALGTREQTLIFLAKTAKQIADGQVPELLIQDRLAWRINGRLITSRGARLSHFAGCNLAIDKAGSILGAPWWNVLSPEDLPKKDHEDLVGSLGVMLMPALFAISLMNCKNVTTRPVDPDRDLNRERKKGGRRPFVRFHTIDIDPMRRVLRTEGQSETQGLRRAIHKCRGHFAHYEESRPLFGRKGLHGRFWIPLHVRGNPDLGTVESEYRVEPPSKEES